MFCEHEKTAPGSGPRFQRGVGRTTQDSLRRAAPLKERLGSMGREQKRIELIYGLFLVCGKKHLPGQIRPRSRLLPRPGKTLARQGFPLPLRCDYGVGVTVPQSAEFCTCIAGVGAVASRARSRIQTQVIDWREAPQADRLCRGGWRIFDRCAAGRRGAQDLGKACARIGLEILVAAI